MLGIFKKVNIYKNTNKYKIKDPPSKILKISNIIALEKISQITDSELDDTCYDITEELKNHGELVEAFIIKPSSQTVGAIIGTMFAEFTSIEEA